MHAVQLLRSGAVASAAAADAADAEARRAAPSLASLLAPAATDESTEGAARYERQSELERAVGLTLTLTLTQP